MVNWILFTSRHPGGEDIGIEDGHDKQDESLRPISLMDFKQALSKMRESRVYNRQAEALIKMDLD